VTASRRDIPSAYPPNDIQGCIMRCLRDHSTRITDERIIHLFCRLPPPALDARLRPASFTSINNNPHLILPIRYSWGEEEHNALWSLEVFVRTYVSHRPAVASDTVATKIVLRGPWRGADGLGRWLPLVWSAPSAYEDDGDCFPFSTSEHWGKITIRTSVRSTLNV
ncbi:hypothetical protein BD310DRAFT_912780, partial [Dichomitus squalens]